MERNKFYCSVHLAYELLLRQTRYDLFSIFDPLANLTTLGYLLALFLTLVHHPEAMARIQEEIDSVIGRRRRPTAADRTRMPYTQATIVEIVRYATNLPLTAARTATRDMRFDDFGVNIQEGTAVLINAWYIHHDERIFEDPWAFKPERFLDARGQIEAATSPKRKAVYGFGIGDRACPAGDFAAARLFLFVTSVLQKFDLSKPTNPDQWPSCDPRDYMPGAILQPKPFLCKVNKRAA